MFIHFCNIEATVQFYRRKFSLMVDGQTLWPWRAWELACDKTLSHWQVFKINSVSCCGFIFFITSINPSGRAFCCSGSFGQKSPHIGPSPSVLALPIFGFFWLCSIRPFCLQPIFVILVAHKCLIAFQLFVLGTHSFHYYKHSSYSWFCRILDRLLSPFFLFFNFGQLYFLCPLTEWPGVNTLPHASQRWSRKTKCWVTFSMTWGQMRDI